MTPCQSRAIIFPSTLANPFCIKLANKLCANMTVYWFGGIERIKTCSQYWEKRIAWGAAKSNGIRFAIWPPRTWIESRSGPAWISLFPIAQLGAISLHLFTLNFIENVAPLHSGISRWRCWLWLELGRIPISARLFPVSLPVGW